MVYACPICDKKMPREVLIYTAHTEEHIVEEIKKKHPEWAAKDGLCVKCLDYFRKAMGKESSQ